MDAPLDLLNSRPLVNGLELLEPGIVPSRGGTPTPRTRTRTRTAPATSTNSAR
jgi:hypothetical protein